MEVGSMSLMSVSVEREPKLTLGAPKKLFSELTPGVALHAGYDVSGDAQRFLMVQVNDPNIAKRGIASWRTGTRSFASDEPARRDAPGALRNPRSPQNVFKKRVQRSEPRP
jgi:hypothetical protein